MSEFLSVFITTPTQDEAEKIAYVLVEAGLVACANIWPRLKSIYRFKNELEQANECALVLKIKAERFDEIKQRVTAMHSYECPCIVAMEIVAGNEPYMKWLEDS